MINSKVSSLGIASVIQIIFNVLHVYNQKFNLKEPKYQNKEITLTFKTKYGKLIKNFHRKYKQYKCQFFSFDDNATILFLYQIPHAH